MTTAFINRIAPVVPPHDVHKLFIDFAATLVKDDRDRALFNRMSQRSQIEHRYCCVEPAPTAYGSVLDAAGQFRRGAFPPVSQRMAIFDEEAPALAARAVAELNLGKDVRRITHLVVTTCTGLTAPGLDLQLIPRCGLPTSVERTMIGFMGCYAAMNGLKAARHIVRSEPDARVLLVNLEFCTLHLQETQCLDQILSFLLFGDGCAASLITAEPHGIALEKFRTVVVPDTDSLITWKIQELGFDMFLSGQVPAAIKDGLHRERDAVLNGLGPSEIDLWAIHPGGRTILDAVEDALELPPAALEASRGVLRDFGNMSSPTIMFVLHRLMQRAPPRALGCGLAFGPGLTAEALQFRMAA